MPWDPLLPCMAYVSQDMAHGVKPTSLQGMKEIHLLDCLLWWEMLPKEIYSFEAVNGWGIVSKLLMSYGTVEP